MLSMTLHPEELRDPVMEKPTQFDAAKAESFAGNLLQTLNYGALCLMTSIGHRTGSLRPDHHLRRHPRPGQTAQHSQGNSPQPESRRNLPDAGHPIGTFLYAISTMHCMTVSLARGGEGLGAMLGEEKTRDYLKRAGFSSVETHQLAHDIQNNWYVVRK
jgi:hypothetical protein